MTDPTRPRPILDAIRAGAWKTIIGTLLTAAVSFGVLNADQATALDNVVAAAVTLLTLVTSVLAQFGVLHQAEPEVTPLAAPRDNTGARLVPSPPRD